MSGRISGIFRAVAFLVITYVVASILLASRKTLRGNHESLVFHEPGCRFYGARNCTETFKSRKAAIEAGFSPARCCHD